MSKIAVLGGGNGAHAAAADLTLRGYEVNLYEDAAFAPGMREVFETKRITVSGIYDRRQVDIAMVTSDLARAVDGVEYILVVVPAFAHKTYAAKLAAVVRPGQVVVMLPGTFGSLVVWKALQQAGVAGVVVAESHTLPYAARLAAPGEVVIMDRFDPLIVGVMPSSRAAKVWGGLGKLFPGSTAAESVVACGLSSLNPIIHVPGCILNAGRIEYAKGEFFFYTEGFTDCVVRTTEAMDRERIALLQTLGYRWQNASRGIGGGDGKATDDLKQAVAGNKSFAKIKGPANVKNRYYAEDIPYGLALWAKLAKQLGIQTPIMDAMVVLGGCVMGQDCWAAGHSMEDLGLAGKDAGQIQEYLIQG